MILDVRQEVEKLLAEMRETPASIEDVRQTIEIAAIVRQMALPTISIDTPPSFIPAIARATVLGAWVQYDRNRALDALHAL